LEIKSLNKNSEFSYIRKFGKKNKFNFITISTTKNENNDFKLGFQISTKTGNAVFRNKIRRQLKDIFYQFLKKYDKDHNKTGLWILVNVNPKIEKFHFSEYKSFLEKIDL
tara:strand:- start:2120 stop:2449 length:330 start_codon:yes stop_codon:yes gene_type:complete